MSELQEQKLTPQQWYRLFSKIGRNDICLCGSKLKFKNCCSKKLEDFKAKRANRTPEKKLSKDEKILRELMSFGKQSLNHKKHQIIKEDHKAKGTQLEQNITAATQKTI